MTSQRGEQTIAIHILTNISKSKGNQAMKLGQLIEYNMRNIFFEKSYIKCDGEFISRPFGTNFPASFSAWFFEEKYFSCYILLPDQISLSGCLYFVRY